MGDDRIFSLNLVGELNKILGTNIEKLFDELRIGDVEHSIVPVAEFCVLLWRKWNR